MAEVACVVDCRDELGESPVWCPVDQRLYWLDIKGQSISWFTPGTGEYNKVPVDEQPGSLVLREQGGMVVAFYGGFRFFDPDTGAVEDHPRGRDRPARQPHERRPLRPVRPLLGRQHGRRDGGPPARLALPARSRPQPAQDRDRHRRLQFDCLQPRRRHHVFRRSRPGCDLGLRPRHRVRRDLQQASLRRPRQRTRHPRRLHCRCRRLRLERRAGTAGASPASHPMARWTAPSRCPSSRSPVRCSAAPTSMCST